MAVKPTMTLQDLLSKTCLIGLTYMNAEGDVLKLSQLSGTVISVDEEEGISIELFSRPDAEEVKAKNGEDSDVDKPAIFHLPPGLNAWFVAPPGHYKNEEHRIDLKDPDYFVTWDIVKKKDDTAEGTHEWWEWHPRTVPPSVG